MIPLRNAKQLHDCLTGLIVMVGILNIESRNAVKEVPNSCLDEI
jgi:hypothetical protein